MDAHEALRELNLSNARKAGALESILPYVEHALRDAKGYAFLHDHVLDVMRQHGISTYTELYGEKEKAA